MNPSTMNDQVTHSQSHPNSSTPRARDCLPEARTEQQAKVVQEEVKEAFERGDVSVKQVEITWRLTIHKQNPMPFDHYNGPQHEIPH